MKKIIVTVVLLLVSSLIALATLNVSTTALDDGSITSHSYLTKFSFIPPAKSTAGLCTGSNLHNYRKSGWPLRYKTNIVDEPGCGDVAYPLLFVLDLLFFLAIMSLVFVVIKKLSRKH